MAGVRERNLLNSRLSLLRRGFFTNHLSLQEVRPFLPRCSTSSCTIDISRVGLRGASYW